MEQDADGLRRLPDDFPAVPLTLPVKATKPQWEPDLSNGITVTLGGSQEDFRISAQER